MCKKTVVAYLIPFFWHHLFCGVPRHPGLPGMSRLLFLRPGGAVIPGETLGIPEQAFGRAIAL
jgi:hypothetical protein